MRRRTLVGTAVGAAVLSAGALTAAAAEPALRAHGPVSVHGTTASARFDVGDRTIRQFRYADRQTMTYTFVLANDGPLPLTVQGVSGAGHEATLLHVDRLVRAGTAGEPSSGPVSVPAGGEAPVSLVVDMRDCEHVSSRAGSFLGRVRLRGEVAGFWERSLVVTLPEELHTGSPREAFCPRATASSRSPG